MSDKFKLRDYQKAGVMAIEKFGDRALLADDMGLGKTLQACHWLRRGASRGLLPAVIICPASVKYNWQHEAYEQCGLTSTVIEGRAKKDAVVNTDTALQIINSDILPSWTAKLLATGPRTIVADECHTFCNPEATRSKHAAQLFHAPSVKGALGISGTPINNRPGEFWHILNLLRPDIFDSRLAFGFDYCTPKYEKDKMTYPGSRNELQLHELLTSTLMIRRLKSDVALELPEQTRVVYTLPLSDPKEYKVAAADVVAWLKKTNAAKALRAKRNKALSAVGYLRRLAARLKTPAALDWLEEAVDSVGRMVLFTCHDQMLKAVLERWPGTPYIDGTINARERQARMDKFQRGGSPFIVGQVVAMGSGVTLHAASHTVMLEMDFRPAVMLQAEARTHRIGQHFPTFSYYLTGQGTIEERICRILQEKQDVISQIMDGTTDAYELNIYDLLLKEICNA